ncbi:VQ motif-containing protein 4-like [Zingiber officinale]|uniref:VQ domain-containing protein n=1 Tax=Zingiber officinale TaxID=94328 RepID=A0A8J5FPQ6_ZINOF|nr:VQ motif-containing protein 4-like [Zingiber officinale]KAG6489051.1 hypothetical protein ZIOFF_050309 [Zingiber officinale]
METIMDDIKSTKPAISGDTISFLYRQAPTASSRLSVFDLRSSVVFSLNFTNRAAMFDRSNGVAATGATPASWPLSLPPKPSSCATFIQADAASFKQVVQMLTGSTTGPASAKNPAIRLRKPTFKLYERRGSLKNQNSPSVSWRNTPEILHPSLTLSPVTPLIADPFERSPQPAGADSPAGVAVAEGGFSLHHSPAKGNPPRLLPLFPVTSPPRVPSA